MHPVVHMFLLLFFLEVVGLVNLTRYEAQSTVVSMRRDAKYNGKRTL